MLPRNISEIRPRNFDDFEDFEIETLEDMMFEYDNERDLESELTPYIDLLD
ncbi:hypothetical protein GW916_09840 [bacterium]|nr:hypothetical protein [bacterium]